MHKIIIGNVNSQIVPQLDIVTLKKLDFELSYAIEGVEFSRLVREGKWDGRRRFLNKRNQSFSTGFLSRVRNVFNQLGIAYEVEDKRVVPQLGEPYNFKYQLRDYQEEAVVKMIDIGRGIVKAPTGSGKTVLIGKFISQVNVPTLVVVTKKSLLNQMHSDLTDSLGVEIGWIGEGICEPKRITVATYQSLMSAYNKKLGSIETEERREIIRSVLEGVDSLICDETHHLVAKSLQFLERYAKKSYYRIGCSATPFRDLDDDILVERFTGRCIVNITASDLIKKGYLSKPTITFYKFKHDRQPSNLSYENLYMKEICQNVRRNGVICKKTLEFVTQNKSVLIAVTRLEHGRLLESLLKPVLGDKVLFVNGEFISEDMMKALNDLNDKKLMCVIATTIFGEGVNVRSLDVLINTKAATSRVDTLQLTGRTLRKTGTKNKVDIIDFWDFGCRFFELHARFRLSAYMVEDEFEVNYAEVD